MGEQFAQMSQLKLILNKALFFIKPEILEKLYLIMDYNGKGAVNEKEFMTIMRPWASFSATDINNDNELDVHELKTLIWLMDNEEPDDRRVQKDLKLIDEDGSGTIDRLEWIQYLATPDGEGADFFDFNLKQMFDDNDKDHDGAVNFEEFNNIIKETYKHELMMKSDEGKIMAEEVIKSLAQEIFKELDSDG